MLLTRCSRATWEIGCSITVMVAMLQPIPSDVNRSNRKFGLPLYCGQAPYSNVPHVLAITAVLGNSGRVRGRLGAAPYHGYRSAHGRGSRRRQGRSESPGSDSD